MKHCIQTQHCIQYRISDKNLWRRLRSPHLLPLLGPLGLLKSQRLSRRRRLELDLARFLHLLYPLELLGQLGPGLQCRPQKYVFHGLLGQGESTVTCTMSSYHGDRRDTEREV